MGLTGIRTVKEGFEGVVFRMGKVKKTQGSGFHWNLPIVDKMVKVDMRVKDMGIPAQDLITSDGVSLKLSAVTFYQRTDAEKTLTKINDVENAVLQLAQTSIRNVVARCTLVELQTGLESLSSQVQAAVDSVTEPWGVKITSVELKDLQLPDSMVRAMGRQAEAEKEAEAKVIAASGEARSAAQLLKAGKEISTNPVALQLRTLQVLGEIGADNNTIMVIPAALMSGMGDLTRFINDENMASKIITGATTGIKGQAADGKDCGGACGTPAAGENTTQPATEGPDNTPGVA